MEEMDDDEIEVVGEIRTTGANKGHRPRPFRFSSGRVPVHRPRPEPGKKIEAIFALHRRGVPTLKAKRAVETALQRKKVVLDVPVVEDLRKLAADLSECGFSTAAMTGFSVDVKKLRERVGLTQEQFALRFGLELDAVRNWEYGRREPDRAAKSYLTVIDKDPERVQEALCAPVS